MTERFRRLYGAGPLHLLALIASLLIAGAAVTGWFDTAGTLTSHVLIWFVGAIIGHDLVLLPLYSALDRIAFGARQGRATAAGPAPEHSPGWVYVRVPALLSGLLALVFFPEILRLGNQTFQAASGMTQDVYLSRFLVTCGIMFAVSGVAYAVDVGRARRDLAAAVAASRAEVTHPTEAGSGLHSPPGGSETQTPAGASVAEAPAGGSVAERTAGGSVGEAPAGEDGPRR